MVSIGELLECGWWVPHGAYGKPFFDKFTRSGLPAHCEPHVRACLQQLGSKRRNVAVDGGAYVGIWSAHLVQHFKRVIAFEPMPVNVELYKRNIEDGRVPKGHHVQIEELALSNNERVALISDIGKPYGHRFVLPGDATPKDLIPISTVALDQYSFEALDLLKLDVEGHEFEALQGAENTIRKFKPVVIIEEKLDPEKRATHFLQRLGMRRVWSSKHDHLFTW